jgi:hypothetical protein
MTGLPVSNIVNVTVELSPRAAQERNFGSLLILGDSNVIDTTERSRPYTSSEGIGADLGTDSPEYKAGVLYFSQSPKPQICYVGRWARTATRGQLRGAVLSAAQRALANFTAVVNGGMNITVDGIVQALVGLNFSAQTNLNGVASVVQTALGASATVTWDANNGRFLVRSATTGEASGVSFATAPNSGTDVSALLGLRSTSGGYSVQGVAAESLLSAVQALGDASTKWYGLQIAASATPTDDDCIAVAGYIEAARVSRIFGVTTQDPAALDSVSSNDLASRLKAQGFKRTFTLFCSSNPHAAASIFGRAFTVNFDGAATTITLKFKQLPGISAEALTESQAAALASRNCNVFVDYDNETAIVQEGVMANGFFFDEVHGTDWLQNSLQTGVYNHLYTAPKVPQTDAGVNQEVAVVSDRLDQAVANGLLAPGVWNGPPLGAVRTGDTLSAGYYVYAPPIATQAQADREKRRSPVIQAAVKLAGAIHFADVLVSCNR